MARRLAMGRSRKAASGAATMPLCQYGSACTRKDCIYRHPPRGAPAGGAAKPCLAFVAGSCAFGRNCAARHPSEEECCGIRLRLARTPCRFGAECRSAACLYKHPEPAAEAVPVAPVAPRLVAPPPDDPTGVPQQWARRDGGASAPGARDTAAAPPPPRTVTVPQDLWTHEVARDSSAFHIADPLERYRAVNARSVPPPGEDALVDLHFQTLRTVGPVLDAVLVPLKGRVAWVVTGTGHHRSGHQAEGTLFAAVEEYLKERRLPYEVAKDVNGYRGAFRVRL